MNTISSAILIGNFTLSNIPTVKIRILKVFRAFMKITTTHRSLTQHQLVTISISKHQPVKPVLQTAISAHKISSTILLIASVVSVIISGWITFAWNPARRDLQVNGIVN
jgi:hypothetical protein